MPIHASQLVVFPVKSCAPIVGTKMEFDAFGPCSDRRFMVVDPEGNKLTQREIPRLARLRSHPYEKSVSVGFTDLDEDMVWACSPREDQQTMQVNIWGDQVSALVMRDDINQWLSERLGQPVRMVRMPDTFPRLSRGTRDQGSNPARVGFADGYPLLIVSEASVTDLNSRLRTRGKDEVHWMRFRPNIVLSGCQPYEEDSWAGKVIKIGNMRIRVTVPCARCVVITTDQMTGKRMKGEPLKTLAGYRKVGKEIRFGMNADHLNAQGMIRRGDEVRLLN